MRQWRRWLVAMVCVAAAWGCAPTEPQTDVSIGLDPQCEELLTQMCDTLRVADGFDVTLDATYMEGYGETLERVDAEIFLSFRRPEFMYVTAKGIPEMGTLVWHNGLLTVVDQAGSTYARIEAPNNIDELIALAADEEIPLPLGALLSADPYAEIVVGIEQSYYLGEEPIGDRMCHHMAFIGEEIDWEVWLDAASQGLPAKWVVTYKYRPDMPRRIETFTRWLITKRWHNFASVPPAEATQVTLEELMGAATVTPREVVDEQIDAAGQEGIVITNDAVAPADVPAEGEDACPDKAPESDTDTPCGDDVGGCGTPDAAPARPIFEDVTVVETEGCDMPAEQSAEPDGGDVEFVVSEENASIADDEPADDIPADGEISTEELPDNEPVTTPPADDVLPDDEPADGELQDDPPTDGEAEFQDDVPADDEPRDDIPTDAASDAATQAGLG
jgi:hypothetical protein